MTTLAQQVEALEHAAHTLQDAVKDRDMVIAEFEQLLASKRDELNGLLSLYTPLVPETNALRTALKEARSRQLESSEIQMTMLAYAELSLRRPGWHYTLRLLAEKVEPKIGPHLYEQFRVTSADIVHEASDAIHHPDPPEKPPDAPVLPTPTE